MTDIASLPGALGPGDHHLSMLHGGLRRTFLVHVPRTALLGAPLPIVVNYHGGGSNARQQRGYSGLDATAERHGFVAVHPDGTGVTAGQRRLLTWNAGGCCPPASARGVDDVGFTLAMVEALAARLPLDRGRLYATGMSNGGMMAHRLAADASEHVAAIAAVAGQLNVTTFAPRRPVPVMEMHSVDDERAAYDGRAAPVLTRHGRLRAFPPVQAGIDAWVAHDGCPPRPALSPPLLGAPGTPDDGQTATRITYGPGRDGSEVVLIRLTGVGHVWPGARSALPRLLGRATSLLDANEVAWQFFAAHRR